MNGLFRNKNLIFAVVFLFPLYFLLRLIALTDLPIFTDEAIYLRWAQIAGNDANWRFISLTDGKQPLFIWFTIIALRVFEDPLVAGRMVSVGAGIVSAVGLLLLTRELFKNTRMGIIAMALYVIFPFALVYDRMALYDSVVGTFAVWGLYFSVLLVRKLRLDIALLMGFITGGAVLNKTSGFFSLALLPFALLLFNWNLKDRWPNLFKFAGLSAVVLILTFMFYAILRLSPFFYIIEEKNAIFVYPISEWIKHPFAYFIQNLRSLSNWFITYTGLPFIILAILSFFIKKDFFREKALLIVWFILPFIYLVFFGKTLYPRYIFFMTLSLIPLIAFALYHLVNQFKKTKNIAIALISLLLLYIGYVDYMILQNFGNAPIPNPDKGQYLTDWPSGTGINESKAFFQKEAEKGKIVISTGGTFGLLPYAYELYFHDNPNVKVKGYWPINNEPPEEVVKDSLETPTYFVFYQECMSCEGKGIAPSNWPVDKVLQIKKIAPNTFLTVYKVRPK